MTAFLLLQENIRLTLAKIVEYALFWAAFRRWVHRHETGVPGLFSATDTHQARLI